MVQFPLCRLHPTFAAWHLLDGRRQSRFDEAGEGRLDATGWRLWPGMRHGSGEPQRELPGRAGVAGNKVFDMLWNGDAFDVATGLNFEGDIFRDVFRPMLQRVECHDANRIVELP